VAGRHGRLSLPRREVGAVGCSRQRGTAPHRRDGRAAWTGYVAVLWLALLVLPIAVPSNSLDGSWYALRLRRMANVAA
jgi:hypothetical protein